MADVDRLFTNRHFETYSIESVPIGTDIVLMDEQ